MYGPWNNLSETNILKFLTKYCAKRENSPNLALDYYQNAYMTDEDNKDKLNR